MKDDRSRRWRIFQLLAPYFGRTVHSSFLQHTQSRIPEIRRVHPLIKGMYKPEWSEFVLSLASMLRSPYSDEVHEFPDGRWWIRYSPEVGRMDIAANAALMNCLRSREPVLVLRQLSDKTGPSGATYRCLGLALVQKYDPKAHLFTLEQVALSILTDVCRELPQEDLIASTLRTETMGNFDPFVREQREVYQVSKEKRDVAFRDVVLGEYGHTCAVSGMRFKTQNHVEAQAAHIIPKRAQGCDDPRNGLALSRSMHWAFDLGVFTVSDQYTILVNPRAHQSNSAEFPVLTMQGRTIRLPEDKQFWPSSVALAWHRKEVFERFAM